MNDLNVPTRCLSFRESQQNVRRPMKSTRAGGGGGGGGGE